jgi:DinB family protein
MLRHVLLLALCLVTRPGSLSAQTPPASDPISGLWGSRESAGLDLKFDGRGALTGTVYITGAPSAPIESGSFDPQTRALKISGHAAAGDGTTGPFKIEGTLDGNALTLNFAFGEHTGTATMHRADAAPPPAPSVSDAAPALRKTFGEASDWVTKAAALVPADKYSYRPAKTVRSFGQIVAHVADAYNYSCAQAAGRTVEWSPTIENGPIDKPTVVARLEEARRGCEAAYASPTNVAALVENVAHTNLHYGNLVTYIRMLNLVPPSSAR